MNGNIKSKEKKYYDIIMPFYKDYNFLDQCINCINNQFLKPKKFIFIDDGNNNKNLKKIIKKKLNKKIKLIFVKNKFNCGPEVSLHKSFKFITSPFFYIYATDDIIYPRFAKHNLSLLSKYKEQVFIFSDIKINNLVKKKKIKIKLDFLEEKPYSAKEVLDIFKKNQFKIYHNTVFFRKKFFMKSNIHKPWYGKRNDMLNLLKLASEYGFLYTKKCLSSFTIRKDQYGKMQSDQYLLEELKFLKRKQKSFYKFFISSNLHFDLSIFAIYNLLKNNLSEAISIQWFKRSVNFYIWKKIRFLINEDLINLIFKFFR